MGGRMLGRLAADPEIKQHKLDRGTARRVIAYGSPFKGLIIVFLITVIVSSALSVARTSSRDTVELRKPARTPNSSRALT